MSTTICRISTSGTAGSIPIAARNIYAKAAASSNWTQVASLSYISVSGAVTNRVLTSSWWGGYRNQTHYYQWGWNRTYSWTANGAPLNSSVSWSVDGTTCTLAYGSGVASGTSNAVQYSNSGTTTNSNPGTPGAGSAPVSVIETGTNGVAYGTSVVQSKIYYN